MHNFLPVIPNSIHIEKPYFSGIDTSCLRKKGYVSQSNVDKLFVDNYLKHSLLLWIKFVDKCTKFQSPFLCG